jgi:hypothetical protein
MPIEVDPSQVHSIEVDPSQVQAMAAPTAPPAGSAVSRAAGSFWDGLNPFPALKHYLVDLPQAQAADYQSKVEAGNYAGAAGSLLKLATPGSDFVPDQVKAQADQFHQAYQAATDSADPQGVAGRVTRTLGHTAAGALPFVGPLVENSGAKAGQQIAAGDYAGAAGTVGAAGVQLALPELLKGVPKVAGKIGDLAGDAADKLTPKIASHLDPTEAMAVGYGQDEGAHLPASVLTGSPMLAHGEKLLSHVPLAAGVARDARARLGSELGALGDKEVGNLGAPDAGPAPTALDVGEAIHSKLDSALSAHQSAGPGLVDSLGATKGVSVPSALEQGEAINQTAIDTEKAHLKAAGDSYDLFRSIESQPQFKVNLQTGTRRVDTGTIDETGNPIFKSVPVMQDIQLPVDRLPAQQALRPIRDRLERGMPLTQQQSSVGLKALNNIVDGPRFESASITDEDLGAIKAIARDSSSESSRGLAKLAVQQLSKAVDQAAQRAGPDAVAALQAGRASTVARYGAQDFQSALGFTDVGSSAPKPGSAVDLTSRLLTDGDRKIDLLRAVQRNAPQHIPGLAQIAAKGFTDQVAGGAADQAVSGFGAMGDATKKILFPDAPVAPGGASGPSMVQRLGGYFDRGQALQAAKSSLPPADSLVSKVTQAGDKSVDALRAIAAHSPELMPGLAQSVTQGLIDSATAEAGMAKPGGALRKFIDMGPVTKQILYQDAYPTAPDTSGGPTVLSKAERVQSLLTLLKKSAENPNPSGSGPMLSLVKGAGLVLFAPWKGVPLLLGSRSVAKMLFNPAESRLMMTAIKMPRNSGAAGELLAKQIVSAAGSGVKPLASLPVPTTAAGVSTPAAGSAIPGSNGLGTPGVSNSATAANAARGGGTQGGGGVPLRSADTNIPVPGKPGPGDQAQYKLRELADVSASHSGQTFLPNPKYGLKNDRNYATAVNQGKIVTGASRSEFKPALHITDNADASNGPIITDAQGQVLGGNGRKMILDRVYSGNPKGAAAYRDLLTQKADQYGIDPAAVAGMKQPVLTREIPESEFSGPNAKQKAITDFNKKGTAELTPAEQAISDSKGVSAATLHDMAGRLEAKGPEASVADVLQGKAGGEVLEKLVNDGVVSPQEKAAFVNSDNELTPAGKARISALLVGRFFRDPAQLDTIAPSIRGRIERMAAPLASVESKPGWDLTPHIQDALEILERSRQLKVSNVDDLIRQEGLFGRDKYSPQGVTLAKALQGFKSQNLTKAARTYAEDAAFAGKGVSMFGDAPTPEGSFAAFEKEPAPEAPSAKNSLAPKAPRKKD